VPAAPADARGRGSPARGGAALSGRLRRLGPALPLLAVYLILVSLYVWQASQRETITLFSDEIEFTQISRSIAETGDAALRGGDPAPGASLYQYLAAPAWWLDDTSAAYQAIKVLGVLLMTAAVVPAYLLARIVVSRPYALFAATATVAAPALSYSPFLVEEPMAYPASALALYAIARAGLAPAPLRVLLAVGACVVGVLVRSQLAVLFVVLGLVLLARAWRSERLRRWRTTWSTGDWVGLAVLSLGAAAVLSAAIGRRSFTWYVATAFYKDRMLEYGLWAAGALAIGIGVVPFVAGLAALVQSRDGRDERRATFVVLSASTLLVFGFYTAVKTAYLSTTFAVVIAERNLIYVLPVLFAGTALVLEQRRPSIPATVAATAFAVYLVATNPLSLNAYPNYEAHGLSIVAFANRIMKWPEATIETALVVVALAGGIALATLAARPPRRAMHAVVGAIAVFSLSWALTAEVYAARGERHESDRLYAALVHPADWVDRATGGAPTLLVGQGLTDPIPIWQLEFWNRSITWLWGMDGSAPGPGARATPNLVAADGTHDPVELGAAYALAVNGVEINAPQVTKAGGAVLFHTARRPVRLKQTTTGIAPDGWMSRNATYTRYAVESDPRGFVKVGLSRRGACFPQLEPARVTARIGPVEVDRNDQPGIAEVTARRSTEVPACADSAILLPAPTRPWRVEVELDGTFVPRELDSNLGDARELGAVVSFQLVPLTSG
jgi:hypothetical protein